MKGSTALRLLAGGIALGATTAYYAWRESKQVDLTETIVEIPDLPLGLDGLRILHLADTHFPANGESLPRFLRAVRAHRYDLVLATGDYAESDRGWPVVVEAFRQIEPNLGVYAVIGGHERYRGPRTGREFVTLACRLLLGRRGTLRDPAPLIQRLRDLGVTVLINDNIAVEIAGEVVRLIGIDDAYIGLADLPAATGGRACRDLPGFPILLSHTPDGLLDPLARDVPLALCGHTHGGQIRVPWYGAPVRHTRSVDRLHTAGLLHFGKTRVVVSRGFGTAALPLRLGCRPEVGVVELRRANAGERPTA